MNSSQIKEVVQANKAKFTGETGKPEYSQMGMFMPVATEGKPVVTSQRRLDFLNKGIDDWRLYHVTRAFAIMGVIAAVLLLTTNVYLSIVAAMAAAWSYGEFIKKDFVINVLYKRRYLLEGT